MALPKQHLPIFTLTLPSNKQKYKFRPFTVKEEKILALAQEDGSEEIRFNAIGEIINNCFEGKLQLSDMALFDVEYVITQLRAKSVGEVIELVLGCNDDEEHKTPYNLDVSKIEVVFSPDHKTTIELFDDVGVKMRYPSVVEMNEVEGGDIVDSMILCVESIYDSKELHKASEYTKAELKDWFESLSQDVFDKIKTQFFDTAPEYKHTFEYKCKQCGKKHTKTIRGLANFFI